MRTSTILVCLFLACASFVCGQQCGQPYDLDGPEFDGVLYLYPVLYERDDNHNLNLLRTNALTVKPGARR